MNIKDGMNDCEKCVIGGDFMKLFIMILFLVTLLYCAYRFIELLLKMKQTVKIPASESELDAIRIFPQKAVVSPTYAKQKWGIMIYSFMLLFVMMMFILGLGFNWSYHLLLFIPLINSRNSFNLFAVVEDGVLCGNRFIAWEKVRSFEINPIDCNHKFYGYTKEVNDGYELVIKTRGRSFYCIVTTTEMLERLTGLITEQISRHKPL